MNNSNIFDFARICLRIVSEIGFMRCRDECGWPERENEIILIAELFCKSHWMEDWLKSDGDDLSDFLTPFIKEQEHLIDQDRLRGAHGKAVITCSGGVVDVLELMNCQLSIIDFDETEGPDVFDNHPCSIRSYDVEDSVDGGLLREKYGRPLLS